MRVQTCEPVSTLESSSPVVVVKNRIRLSAVPAPLARSPGWCGDHAIALHGSAIAGKTPKRSCAASRRAAAEAGCRPDHRLIVVSSGRQHSPVRRPLESTHLLPSAAWIASSELARAAHVTNENGLVLGSRRESVRGPGHARRALRVPRELSELLICKAIKDGHGTRGPTTRNLRACLCPRDARARFTFSVLDEVRYLCGPAFPRVDVPRERDSEDIRRAPREEVQVEVVDEGWGIENLHARRAG